MTVEKDRISQIRKLASEARPQTGASAGVSVGGDVSGTVINGNGNTVAESPQARDYYKKAGDKMAREEREAQRAANRDWWRRVLRRWRFWTLVIGLPLYPAVMYLLGGYQWQPDASIAQVVDWPVLQSKTLFFKLVAVTLGIAGFLGAAVTFVLLPAKRAVRP